MDVYNIYNILSTNKFSLSYNILLVDDALFNFKEKLNTNILRCVWIVHDFFAYHTFGHSLDTHSSTIAHYLDIYESKTFARLESRTVC